MGSARPRRYYRLRGRGGTKRVRRLPNLHCLWIGRQLTWREQLCLSSWLAYGHSVTLWAYDPVSGVPGDVTIASADDILPRPLIKRRPGGAAFISDRFRYRLLRSRDDATWLDADVLLLRPLDIRSRYVFGWEAADMVGTAVMRLPCDSPVLEDLLNFIEMRVPVPPWWSRKRKSWQRLLGTVGLNLGHEAMPWGTFGPKAFTEFLRRHQLIDRALPIETFYPVHWRKAELYFAAPDAVTPLLTEATIAVHLWNNIVRQRGDHAPPSGSWLAEMCRHYAIPVANSPAM